MAKNKVVPEKQFKKSKDRFFNKSKPIFKCENKQHPPRLIKEKLNRNLVRSKNKFSSKKDDSLKPSVSGSNDFFVKAAEDNQLGRSIQNAPVKINSSEKTRKPFDKKAWRLRKYSKKYKLQQWEDSRKKAVLRGYYKSIKDENMPDVKGIYNKYDEDVENEVQRVNEENENNLNTSVNEEKECQKKEATNLTRKQKKNKAFNKAHLEFQRIKEERKNMKDEAMKKKLEKEEAIKAYRQKKAEKFKKLSKRTRKGQPIMKGRMEMLLEKIQKTVAS